MWGGAEPLLVLRKRVEETSCSYRAQDIYSQLQIANSLFLNLSIDERELRAWTKNYTGASRMLSSPHIGRWALLQWGT